MRNLHTATVHDVWVGDRDRFRATNRNNESRDTLDTCNEPTSKERKNHIREREEASSACDVPSRTRMRCRVSRVQRGKVRYSSALVQCGEASVDRVACAQHAWPVSVSRVQQCTATCYSCGHCYKPFVVESECLSSRCSYAIYQIYMRITVYFCLIIVSSYACLPCYCLLRVSLAIQGYTAPASPPATTSTMRTLTQASRASVCVHASSVVLKNTCKSLAPRL